MEEDSEARRLLYDVQGAYAHVNSARDLDGMLRAVTRLRRQARFASWKLRRLRRLRRAAARKAAQQGQ
ncbi:hypothetical protein ACBJ59_16275 [Nonomuraea sp. MTCD27]|uniref:hypothetical protein n=1 Tax=Nonomuraea sp. MTCD27 TaxID=1676747 RepID=UPI0035C0DB4F